MAETSAIEWTDATWNPWIGCAKVSPGCDNCYAERDMARYGRGVNTVTRTSPKTFDAPLSWKSGKRVFTCSWGDFFSKQADDWRRDAMDIVEATPGLTYQMLTKRPGRAVWWAKDHGWPDNMWAGTSVENQKYAPRIDVLTRIPAPVRFLSLEPLLGPVDLSKWITPTVNACQVDASQPETAEAFAHVVRAIYDRMGGPLVDWVIVGGESGLGARAMDPQWVRDLRDQCVAAGVPFFFKQWGEWDQDMRRVGRKAAGRVLDGRTWDEMPDQDRVRDPADRNEPLTSSVMQFRLENF